MVVLFDVKQPVQCNAMSSGHVSHRRTSSYSNHLDYCFIVITNAKHGFEVRKFRVCDKVIHIEQFHIISVDVFLRLGVDVFTSGFFSPRFSPNWQDFGRMQHFNSQIPKIESGETVHARTSVQRNNFRCSWTVRERSLLPIHENECSTSEDTQNIVRNVFRIFKVSSKIWVLEQSCAVLPTWQ